MLNQRYNQNYNTYQNCANATCSNQVEIRIIGNTTHSEYGQPIVAHRKRITCSRECHRQWQLSIEWEDRIGADRAREIRKVRSDRCKVDNPSTRPGGAEKVSAGMKRFLKENPDARLGENNPFYGKKHTDEQKQKWIKDKTGKWAYNAEQKAKQTKNTPKKENHPNWNGGSSVGPYGPEFTKELKEAVKENYEHSCQLCGVTGVDLDVHHVDYDKLNNSRSNLVPLCKVCHGKTNYDRQKWQTLIEGMLDRI
jgi:hypothetical protein